MFSWRAEVRPGVWVAFTDAAAGNLALHVGDDPVEVLRRRGGLEAALGLGGRTFQYMNQVHGNDVAIIGAAAGPEAEPAERDGHRVRRDESAAEDSQAGDDDSSADEGLTIGKGALQLRALRLASDRGQLQLAGDYRPRDNFRSALAGRVIFPAVAGAPAATARASTLPRPGAIGKPARIACAASADVPWKATRCTCVPS